MKWRRQDLNPGPWPSKANTLTITLAGQLVMTLQNALINHIQYSSCKQYLLMDGTLFPVPYGGNHSHYVHSKQETSLTSLPTPFVLTQDHVTHAYETKTYSRMENTLSSFFSPCPPPPDCCWPYNEQRNIILLLALPTFKRDTHSRIMRPCY